MPNFVGRRVSRDRCNGFLRPLMTACFAEPLLSHSNGSFYPHEAEWTPFKTHCFSENLEVLGMEAGTSGAVVRNSTTGPQRRSVIYKILVHFVVVHSPTSSSSFFISHPFSHSFAMWSAHLIALLYLRILIKLYLTLSTSHEVTHFAAYSTLLPRISLGPNIILSTLFPNTLRLCSSLNVRDEVLHQSQTTGETVILWILMINL
jgi:hypothetical protein